MYHFLKGWLFDGADLSLETFIEWILLKNTEAKDERSAKLFQLDHPGNTLL